MHIVFIALSKFVCRNKTSTNCVCMNKYNAKCVCRNKSNVNCLVRIKTYNNCICRIKTISNCIYILTNIMSMYDVWTELMPIMPVFSASTRSSSIDLPRQNTNTSQDEPGFGQPRPMLPYSSMFIFGPTNPYDTTFFWITFLRLTDLDWPDTIIIYRPNNYTILTSVRTFCINVLLVKFLSFPLTVKY